MKIAAVLLPALWPLAVWAQDTRTVAEPVIPPVCASLGAKLAVVDGRTVAPEDENKSDTKRIQQALDACPAGKAVELKPDGSSAAFLAGPLQLRAGVTLLVSKGAVLFASRDPREFDIAPGACGIVNTRGRGCKPLIAGDNVAGAAVMGDGVIDGRGWAKLTGQTVSWWDLAQQAKVQNANQNCPRILVLQRCNNFTLYRITLKNSPNFHVSYNGGNGFTAWGVIIDTPQGRPQYRWHRPGQFDQRHHHALLHPRRRRQCRDQGRYPRTDHQHHHLAQPFLCRARHVDRQRNRWRRRATCW